MHVYKVVDKSTNMVKTCKIILDIWIFFCIFLCGEPFLLMLFKNISKVYDNIFVNEGKELASLVILAASVR